MNKKLRWLLIILLVLVILDGSYLYIKKSKNRALAEQKELVENKDIDDEEDNEEISNYQLVNLIVGQTSKLQYDFLANTLSEVKFTSQNSSIGSVDDEGKITGISPGTTTITLEYTGGKLEFYITVNDSY